MRKIIRFRCETYTLSYIQLDEMTFKLVFKHIEWRFSGVRRNSVRSFWSMVSDSLLGMAMTDIGHVEEGCRWLYVDYTRSCQQETNADIGSYAGFRRQIYVSYICLYSRVSASSCLQMFLL